MNYPTWKMKGSPTPYDKLMICKYCHQTRWVRSSDNIHYCYKCGARMKEANKTQYQEAYKALKEII